MKTIITHKDADIEIERMAPGRSRITVRLLRRELFMPYGTCETTYPVDLIEHILDAKGPAWLCDEIMRDESPDYLQENLRYDLLSHISEDEFRGKRLLDFGCGCGASTMVLSRMMPFTNIVGIELNDRLLSVARHRAEHYGFTNVTLLLSGSADQVSGDIGEFDYILLNAVYEHFLPRERKTLLPQMWKRLKPDGILFVTETPYRYFPIELHTTGLPLINYLPDRIAYLCARRFSGRNLKNYTWEDLLRKGIRGATVGEILGNLRVPDDGCKPEPLKPFRLGVTDKSDLWRIQMSRYLERASLQRPDKVRIISLLRAGLSLSGRALKLLGGNIFLSRLSMAIRKRPLRSIGPLRSRADT